EPDSETLSPEQKQLYARMMEVFAGFLTHTDYHIGRLLDYLKSTGEYDNTLIMVISDNGASAEGGPTGTTNEGQFFNNAQESIQESLAKLDKLYASKMIMRPERVTEERLDPCPGQTDCRDAEGPLRESEP